MTSAAVTVEPLSHDQALAVLPGLCEVLTDCVAGGASVNFMAPFSLAQAEAFWRGVIDSVGRGERTLIVARDGADGAVVGTVQVILAQPPNQPHRGDLAKMLVHRRARRRGVGGLLIAAAHTAARAAGKTLLVLDTADATAERLYERAGWVRVGVVPGFALLPEGGLCDTAFYYKRLG